MCVFRKETARSDPIVYFIITDCVQFVKRQMTTPYMYDIITLFKISYNWIANIAEKPAKSGGETPFVSPRNFLIRAQALRIFINSSPVIVSFS